MEKPQQQEENNNRVVRLLKSRLLICPPVDKDPRLLPSKLKLGIIVILMMSVSMPGFSSTIYFPGIPEITADLNAPPIAITLTAALFILMMGIAPVFWGSLSDFYHIRRFFLTVSMTIFTLSSLGCVLIDSIWALVALRCIQGIGASAALSIGGGVVADLYPIEKRGGATSNLFLAMFFGPIIGPIIGGVLTMSNVSWRATFWFCFAYGAVVVMVNIICMPETYRNDKKFDDNVLPTITSTTTSSTSPPALTAAVSEQDSRFCTDQKNNTTTECIEKSSSRQKEKKKTFNPLYPFLLLRYPHIMLASICGGIAFGVMFATEVVLPILYEQKYGFNAWRIGLCYLGAGAGNVLGAIVNGKVSDPLLLSARAKRGGRHVVEDRIGINLWPCCLIMMPLGSLLFGWSSESGMPYWVGIIGFGLQTFGMNQILPALGAYLIDAMPGQGATVTASSTVIRMLFACILTLVATPLLNALGPGYLFLLFAGLSYLLAGLLLINKVYGQRMRRHYGFILDDEEMI